MNTEIESSLVETIRTSELRDLAFDVADALSPVPILGSLAKLCGGFQSINSYFFRKKVLAFLRVVNAIPKEERNARIDELLRNPAEREKFGEHLAFLLERMNEIDKATMMGRVARAFIEGRISLDDMRSLNFALDAIDLRMTGTLQDASEAWCGAATHEAAMLAHCGLMTPALKIETTPLEIGTVDLYGPERTERYETFKGGRIEYTISQLGRLFVEICLTQDSPQQEQPSDL